MGYLLDIAVKADGPNSHRPLPDAERQPAANRRPVAASTTPQEAELRRLYDILAARFDWPMPDQWFEDRPHILADSRNALDTLNNLVNANDRTHLG